jgi:nitroreductase
MSLRLNLTADEVLTTTRSVRKRLDFDRPVERSVLEECIEIALQAPTGSNSQGWAFVVVEDAGKKKAIADYYGKNFDVYANSPASAPYKEGDLRAAQADGVRSSAMYLRENFHRVPYMVIPVIRGRIAYDAPGATSAGFWGSILPAAWSLMLAARERGLGSAWTTLHLPNEKEVAELLGIPYDKWSQAGLFPIAYTIGTDFKPAKRLPTNEFIHWDTW